MFKSKFVWKVYGGYAFLILVTTLVVGFLVSSFVERETLKEVDRQLEVEARLLHVTADLTSEAARGRLRAKVDELGLDLGTRFTVIAQDGLVLADSDEEPALMDNHATRPEVRAASTSGVGTSTRFSRTLKQRMRYLALPYDFGGEARGWVRTSLPLERLEERLAAIRKTIALGAVLATLVGLVAGLVMARRVTRPILGMAASAEAIAEGAYGQRVEVTSSDELGQLATAFNTMTEALRRSMASLEAERNQLTAILSSMVEGVVAVDGDARVVHVNQVAARLLELDPATVTGRPLWEVVRMPEVTRALSEALRSRCVAEASRVVRLPGAADRYLEVHVSPLAGDNTAGGETTGAVLVLHDVTQLRRLEEMRRDFVGNVSHELKTPVTAIRGLVETLIDDADVPQELRQRFLTKISRQCGRLSNLVTDLLSLSRLESEDQPLELEPLDVRDVLDEAVRALQPASEARRVGVERDWGPEALTVDGEEEALRQAVTNLLSNAIKYSPPESTVVVRGRRAGQRVVIEVADQGPGIAPSHQARLFERFYRVDAARSRELGGTGLGLAIVKHIAIALGGEVGLDSAPGEGSTFRIVLPASRDAG